MAELPLHLLGIQCALEEAVALRAFARTPKLQRHCITEEGPPMPHHKTNLNVPAPEPVVFEVIHEAGPAHGGLGKGIHAAGQVGVHVHLPLHGQTKNTGGGVHEGSKGGKDAG